MSYVKLTSVTWWTGVASVAVGVLGIIRPEAGPVSEILGAMLGADGSPASLIALGAGLIGLRAKLERG